MMPKNSQATKTSENKESKKKGYALKALGAFIMAMSVSVFVQAVPFMFLFIGAYLGIPADAPINMDTMVWLLTSVTMMILAVYGFILWMKFLWRKFMDRPNATAVLPFKKKEKRA